MFILKIIQAYIKTFGIIIPIITIIIIFIVKSDLNIMCYSLIYSILIYYFLILIFLHFIFTSTKPGYQNKIYFNYKFLIKDKEFILFKNSLLNIYYTSIIILFYFIFKNNYFFINPNIYFFMTILLIYSFLLSNYFILNLFTFYLILKKNINLFNNINWINQEAHFSLLNNKPKFYSSGILINNKNIRNYSST
jgi:hypothetical protein